MCGIKQLLRLSIQDIQARLKVCKEKIDYFWRHVKRYQQEHLHNHLHKVQDKKDEVSEKNIQAIIQREKYVIFWCRINNTLGKQWGRSYREVDVQDNDGNVTTHNTEREFHKAF